MVEENAFARWSRRKRAARQASITEEAPGQPAAPAPEDRAALGIERPVTEGPADAELPAPLPSLEDLTAESDLMAFLRREVPDQLRRAAMRKMWSLDPAIRDHVGLSECAWDFNGPSDVPGFGAIGATRSTPSFLSGAPVSGRTQPRGDAPLARSAEPGGRPDDPRGEPGDGPEALSHRERLPAAEAEPPSVVEPMASSPPSDDRAPADQAGDGRQPAGPGTPGAG